MIKKVLKKLTAAVLAAVTVVTAIPAVAESIKSNRQDIQTLSYDDNKVNENDIAYENVTIADYDAVAWNLLNLYNMWFKITPYANLGLYLQPHLADGKDVDVWDAGSSYSQWTFEPHEDYFYIKNVNTGKYLWFDTLQNGAKVNVETTNPGWNNRWQLVTNQTTFTYSIRPYADTRYCLDIGGRDINNPEMGDSVHIWEYLGGQNQEWSIDSNAREDYNDFFRYGVGFKAAGLQVFNQGEQGSLYGMAKDIIDSHNYKSSFGFNNNIRMNWNLFNPDADAKVGNINVFREINENYRFPLKIDADGYRYFDSKQMYVVKNDSEKKFELYDGSYDLICHYAQKEWGTSIKNGHFAPYNTPWNTNFQYGFAMTMQLEFYMEPDGKVHIYDENGNETEQSMLFEFTGDDDLWIYIDDNLCLDVGGTHTAKPGNINFDKTANGGKCVAKTYEGDGSVGWQKEFDLSSGIHTLTMFYTERAQDEANLKVRYNLISKNNLKIDPNGGTYQGKTEIVDRGEQLSNKKLPIYTPKRTGYTFTGWDIQGTGRMSANNKYYYMGYNDTTLVAQWKPNEYNLDFDYNKPQEAVADVTNNDIITKKVSYTKTVGELPSPALKGYTFTGWQDENGKTYTEDTVYNVLGDTTLYAQWRKNDYTITFDYNCAPGDAITGNEVKSKGAVYGYAVGELPQPHITGKVFGGWYREDNGKRKYYNAASIYDVDGDMTLKASWSAEQLNVFYHGNGGSYDYEDTLSYTYSYADHVEIHENPFLYDGDGWFEFGGWALTPDGEVKYNPGDYTDIYESMDLYAVWKPMTAQVRYNANGGTGNTYTQTVTWNGSFTTAADNTFTKEGYALIGWDISPAAETSGYMCSVTMPVTDEVFNPYDGFDLYAVWEKSEFKLTFDYNRPQEAENEITGNEISVKNVRFNNPVGELPVPALKGYAFTGWQDENGKTYTEDTVYDTEGDTVLYAQWDAAPVIKAIDRYYTLTSANNGRITRENLMSTASVTDDKDNPDDIEFKIADYSENDFKNLTADAQISITYKAVDSAGNKTYKKVFVHIVDTTPKKIEKTTYVRHISEKYYDKAFEDGGLEPDSVWRKDPEYAAALKSAMENRASITYAKKKFRFLWRDYEYTDYGEMSVDHIQQHWEFTKEDRDKIREFVDEHGVGNSKEPDALKKFYETFGYCRIY